MEDRIRSALGSIRLDWAATPDDVWEPQAPLHVPGLHDSVLDEVLAGFDDAQRSSSSSPLGVAIRGPAGSGKTHLLGQVRERVQDLGGYVFVIKLLDGEDFWHSVLVAMLEDLERPTPTHATQLIQLLDRLGRSAGVDEGDLAAVVGDRAVDRDTLERYISAVYRKNPRHRRRSQHVLRALVLLASQDFSCSDVGEALLLGGVEELGDAAAWGISPVRLGDQEMVENVSRVIAMDGGTLLAVDQIDTLLALADTGSDADDVAVNKVAHGLMSLRETLSRTVSVISCLAAAWDYLEQHVAQSVMDRYRLPSILQRPASADFTRALLAKRLAVFFVQDGFSPPYPTWPVTEAALQTSLDETPRDLIKAVDWHVRSCLRTGEFVEMATFGDGAQAQRELPVSNADPVQIDQLGMLDRRFAELVVAADSADAFDPDREDVVVPGLIAAGLATWIQAQNSDVEYHQDARPAPNRPALHGRLRRTVDVDADIEASWAFRAIAAPHYRSVQSRLDKAATTAGLTSGSPLRSLFLLRREPWPTGAKTHEMIDELMAKGARLIRWSNDDVKVLFALRELQIERSDYLAEWIASRDPAAQVGFLSELSTAATDIRHPASDRTSGPAVVRSRSVTPSVTRSVTKAVTKAKRRTGSERLAEEIGGLSAHAARHLFASDDQAEG